MKQIPLTQGKFSVVDDEDFNTITKMGSWIYSSAGYAVRWDKWNNDTKHRNPIFIHRLLTNAPKGMVVDHINGDTLDNRKLNLRICTTAQNLRNRKLPVTNTTGYHNVHLLKKTGRYRVLIKHQGKGIFLGTFKTVEEAAHVRDEYARKHFEGFARMNFSK